MKYLKAVLAFLIGIVRKVYRAYRNSKSNKVAGFKVIGQREAFELEPRLSYEEKKHYCERKAYAQLGYFPNLDEPETYNEKNIWLALNYKDDRIKTCADKYEVKAYISRELGPEYCVPTIGVYDNVNDIDFDALPERFVAKSTAGWGSKQVRVVKNKSKTDINKLKSYMAEWLYPWNNYYYNNLCITNENIKPRIIIEEFLDDGNEELSDYKVHCFNGKAEFMLIVEGRGSRSYAKTFYSLDDWSVMPIGRKKTKKNYNIRQTDEIKRIVGYAEKLAKDFPVARIDFYIVHGHIYVGEMTLSPGMFMSVVPSEWDKKLGKFINIRKATAENAKN